MYMVFGEVRILGGVAMTQPTSYKMQYIVCQYLINVLPLRSRISWLWDCGDLSAHSQILYFQENLCYTS